MTGTNAPAEPYTTRFGATVERIDGREVVLSETYFYAESGGQPADRGAIAGHDVVDVQYGDGGVVHTLAEAADLSPGETVTGRIDEQFRTYCMRAHTASHVLYGAGRRLLDDLGYGGFDISPEKVRVDFTTSTEIDDETLFELERLVNRAVWESRPVSWNTHPEEDALELDGIAFNTKTEEGITGETVRVVTVGENGRGEGPWDRAACGGTHVENTREIGPVTVLERSNPGEGLTRVEFAVGEPGIERRIAEKKPPLRRPGRSARTSRTSRRSSGASSPRSRTSNGSGPTCGSDSRTPAWTNSGTRRPNATAGRGWSEPSRGWDRTTSGRKRRSWPGRTPTWSR